MAQLHSYPRILALSIAIMQGDPAVAQGVMRVELYPYRVALMAKIPSAENRVNERENTGFC